jgi:type II secretory pathway component PulK
VVLESLAENLNGEYTPEVLASERRNGCFPDLNAFRAIVGAKNLAAINGRYGQTSQYFRLTTHVTLGTTEFTLYSLLLRGNGGKITPLLRSFGTP